MKIVAGRHFAKLIAVVAVFACLWVSRATSQDPELKPTFGSVKLKAGFTPDPHVKELIAGGPIETKLGDVKAWVAKAPDYQLFYTAGNFKLTIHVDCPEDTTLLINLPDGKWVADDDSGGNLNPLLKFEKPQSGRYDIWVGTFNKDKNPKAKLYITELK